jgi:hypothetical protein
MQARVVVKGKTIRVWFVLQCIESGFRESPERSSNLSLPKYRVPCANGEKSRAFPQKNGLSIRKQLPVHCGRVGD